MRSNTVEIAEDSLFVAKVVATAMTRVFAVELAFMKSSRSIAKYVI
jgi:hypothetical protein